MFMVLYLPLDFELAETVSDIKASISDVLLINYTFKIIFFVSSKVSIIVDKSSMKEDEINSSTANFSF